MAYEVQTDVFEGPFDLLLHLILSQQVELYEVSLSTIVDAYLAELDRTRARTAEAEVRVLPDRIETGTYAMAVAMTGGDVQLSGARPELLQSALDVLTDAGAVISGGVFAGTTTPTKPPAWRAFSNASWRAASPWTAPAPASTASACTRWTSCAPKRAKVQWM